MARAAFAVALLLAAAAVAHASALAQGAAKSAAEQQLAANPIRKVVTMLQMMQKKVIAEGEKEKELYDKFVCYCKGSGAALSKSIADANTKIPEVQSDIEEAEALMKQLKGEVAQHQADRTAAKA